MKSKGYKFFVVRSISFVHQLYFSLSSLKRYSKILLFISLLAHLFQFSSCKKDLIDFNPDWVSSVEVFDEMGGRSDWNTTTGKIIYDFENEGRYDLMITDENKSFSTNLTADLTGQTIGGQLVKAWQHRGQPAWSPDGNYVIFQVMNDHCTQPPLTEELLSLGVNNDLWIIKSDGTNPQKLTQHGAGMSVLHPHFSHDGTKIVWAEKYADDDNASIFGAWRIQLADVVLDSAGVASLDNQISIQPGGIHWYEAHGFSPDDQKIFFSSNTDTDFKASDLFSYDLTTFELTNLTQQPAQWEEMHNQNPLYPGQFSFISSRFFDWNNDLGWGSLRTELYLNDNSEIKQLTYYNQLKKDKNKPLTTPHYFIGDHCWGPDGKTILAVLAEVKVGETNGKLLKIKLK